MKKISSCILKSFLVLAAGFSGNHLSAQCFNNQIVNGSFASAEGVDVTASGWSGESSPDVNDDEGDLNCTDGYFWTDQPVSSADGGTWQNIFYFESVGQAVTLVPGHPYTLQFEYAVQGIRTGKSTFYDDPNGADIFFNGILETQTPFDTSLFSWEKFSYTFTAAQSSLSISFGVSRNGYIGIDGVCLNDAAETGTGEYLTEGKSTFYPNPLSSSATIRTEKVMKNATLSIFNSMGHELQQIGAICGNEFRMERNNLPAGIYFYRLTEGNKIISSRKLTITD